VLRFGPINVELLRKNQLFRDLQDAELNEIVGFAKQRRYEPGDRIFARGGKGDCFFVILDGQVAVQTESPNAKVMFLNILSEGEIFGEIAMLDGKERTASVSAQTPCMLLKIDRKNFIPFLERNPPLCIRLMAVLCERIRWTSSIIEDTVFLPLSRRLAKRLLLLANQYGRKGPDGIRITTFISQEELSQMLGVSREIVNKTLKTFMAAGAISYRTGYIIVHDPDYLDRLAREKLDE
jgi:CRP/FNR family transcriptional regulator, cyclic AMP receptor protein